MRLYWRQGITLNTPETSHWTDEQIKANNAVERCLVFANFSIEDGGRSRQLVATCATEGDAQFIAAAPEMFELLCDARRYVADANLRGDGYAEIDLKAIDALLATMEGTK